MSRITTIFALTVFALFLLMRFSHADNTIVTLPDGSSYSVNTWHDDDGVHNDSVDIQQLNGPLVPDPDAEAARLQQEEDEERAEKEAKVQAKIAALRQKEDDMWCEVLTHQKRVTAETRAQLVAHHCGGE